VTGATGPTGASPFVICAAYGDGVNDITAPQSVTIRIPFNCTIQSWEIQSGTSDSGTATFAVETKTLGSGAFTSIVASAAPTVSNAQSASGSTSTWTASLSAGTYVRVTLSACSGYKSVTLAIPVQ
jgi:hypothetical protein